MEDEVAGGFKALIAQSERLDGMQHRQFQGMIPDFKIQTMDGPNKTPGRIRLGS